MYEATNGQFGTPNQVQPVMNNDTKYTEYTEIKNVQNVSEGVQYVQQIVPIIGQVVGTTLQTVSLVSLNVVYYVAICLYHVLRLSVSVLKKLAEPTTQEVSTSSSPKIQVNVQININQ